MRGTDEVEVEVRGPAEAVKAALQSIPQVVMVREHTNGADANLFSVDCGAGQDVRELIARTIVERGWGLRGLRPASVSLEEVFVQLVTAEPITA